MRDVGAECRATAAQQSPMVPAPTTPTRIRRSTTPPRLHACTATAIGSTSDASRDASPDGSATMQDGVHVHDSSAMPPSTTTPYIVCITAAHCCGRTGAAPIALTARHERLHRDRGVVVEHARELVAERGGHRAECAIISRSEPQIPAAPHPHAHPGRVLGLRHVDDAHAGVGVANGSHGQILAVGPARRRAGERRPGIDR